MKRSFSIVIIALFLSFFAWILFQVYQTYGKKVNFENETKCQEYSNELEKSLINKTINLFKYKYWEDLSDEKIIKYKMSPYGMFYSTKHNACMSYFNYDNMQLIEPYMVSRDDAWYYARYCPNFDVCYYLHNKSFDDFSNGIIIHRNEDNSEILYYDINIDDDIRKGKSFYWKINFWVAHADFWYTVSRLWIYETKSWDGFIAHHHTFFAFFEKSRQNFEDYRAYHDWVDYTLIVIWFIVWIMVIYFVSHWICSLFYKTWKTINNKEFKSKKLKKDQ